MTRIADRDECCYEIQEGCGDEEPFPPEFVAPSSCLNDDCSMCSLSYYDATNYLSQDGALLRRIVDYAGGITQGAVVNT